MQTNLIDDNEVQSYGRDFIERLDQHIGSGSVVWASLGYSGDKLAEVLGRLMVAAGGAPPPVQPVSFVRDKSLVIYRHDDGRAFIEKARSGTPIVLIDSAIHSGRSMRKVAEHFINEGAKEVITYALVMKQSSEFVPTFFGLMIGERDRAFFQLAKIPNHRLNPKKPVGRLRRLGQEDVDRDFLHSGTKSIDRATYGDLFYAAHTQGNEVFVYEIERTIAGVLNVKRRNGHLFVDLIARDESFDTQKIGGMLMRWAETYARHTDCHTIELYALATEIGFYRRFKFEEVAGSTIYLGEGESYVKMTRKLLYNIRSQSQVTLDYLDAT